MIDTVLVVIPANNEQALIGSCLDAMLVARHHAADALGRHVTLRTVVVLDACVDATEAQISAGHGVQTIRAELAAVGAARALGVAHARRGLAAEPMDTWIASTDADSRVPPDWITGMVNCADRGADLVLGTVRPDIAPSSSTYRRWRQRYVVAEGHPHVHGANLGVRADVYDRIGGWPLLTSDEDVELVRRAENSDAVEILRTGAVPVTTSVRLFGRAPHGFAGYLRQLPGENNHSEVLFRTVRHLDLPRVDPVHQTDR